jgi:thioredoxin 1
MMKVIKVSTPWCAPCKQLHPVFEKVSIEMTSDDLTFKEIDAEEDFELAEQYRIRNVPTILLIDENEKELKRYVGFINEEKLKEFINNSRNEKEITETI